jgi:hypothetical protein
MLRLVLLVLYLLASSSASPEKQGSGLDSLGFTSPPPTTDAGGGYDPNGALPPPVETDTGAGNDPNG